jgi:hypothetical protein
MGAYPSVFSTLLKKKPSILNKTTKLASPIKQNSHSKFFHSDKTANYEGRQNQRQNDQSQGYKR